MPRVTFVKKARKDNPVAKKGESYYWWKFRYGGKRYSKTRPRPSQLINSPWLSEITRLHENVEDAEITSLDDLESVKDEYLSEVRILIDEARDNLDAVPYQLQETHMLGERVECAEDLESELESVDFDDEPQRDDFVSASKYREAHEQWIEEQKDKLLECEYQGE